MTDSWLAIIGIATVLQLVLLILAAPRGVRLLRRAAAVIDDLREIGRRLRSDDAVRDAWGLVDLVAAKAPVAARRPHPRRIRR